MDLKFDANGLIPAIVQDHYTKGGPDPGLHERREPGHHH